MKKKPNMRIYLSIIIPSYKQEKTITKDIKNILTVIENLNFKYELIIVIDGKKDKTLQRLKRVRSRELKIIELGKKYGKGYAIRKGVEVSTGEIVGFLDAGMDIDPNGIQMLLNHMIWYDADVIVGSKLHPVSQVNYPLSRKILSWGYRTFTHLLFGFKIRDTQAGMKLFKKEVAKDVFNRSLVKEFAFDVEVLALAYALGYKKIYEAPIKLNFSGNSSITNSNFWRIIIRMLVDTLAIYYRLKVRQYYKKSNRKNWITE